jgi:hypothetical protein
VGRVALGKGRAASAPARKSPAKLGYTPPEFQGPPPGSFDPGLEAQVRASERGLLDLIKKTQEEQHRQGIDVGQKKRVELRELQRRLGDVQRSRGYAVSDNAYQQQQLGINFTRDLQDLGTARQRGQQDYERTLSDLQHRYSTAAQTQQERSVQAGTDEAGTAGAAAAVRAGNLVHERAPLDLSHQRAGQSLDLQEQRDRQNFGTASGRLAEGLARQQTAFGLEAGRSQQDTHTSLHALSLAAQRATTDRYNKLSQAKREQAIYSTDVAQQAYYQAHQNNPHILFPGGAPGGGGFNGSAHGNPAAPHVYNAVPLVGLSSAKSFPPTGRRPYTRY